VELNQILHPLEALVAVSQFLDLLVLLSQVYFDGFRLNLGSAVAMAQMAIEALAPRVDGSLLSES